MILAAFSPLNVLCCFTSDSACIVASLVAQTVENLPIMLETWVQSLGWKDPLEKGKATHSSIFAWRIPWTEEPGELKSIGCKELGMTEVTEQSTAQEEDDGGVVVHFSPWIHQEYTFRHRRSCTTPAESVQEYLTTKKNI